MPEKKTAEKMIRHEGVARICRYLEGWTLKTGKDRTGMFIDKLWEEALHPSAMRTLIKYISDLEKDRDELLRAEEQIRRLMRGCYGKCESYPPRDVIEDSE